MEEDMKGFRKFINSSKRRIENSSSTLEYSTGGIPPINGQCPNGFVMNNELGGCVPAGPNLHDMSAPEVGKSYPKGTPNNV
jgi:hypothetical protein